MLEFLSPAWPWYVAGPLIALVMFALLYFGENFGVSNNLRTMCALAGADRFSDFFKIDVKQQAWNLVFVAGSILGGFISYQFLTPDVAVVLSAATTERLANLGFANAGAGYLPQEIFGIEQLTSISGLSVLLVGGMLVGFGARYAGGCTSGHAISGLSNLQIPSLIAVVGFFIGGLLMVHLIMPLIF
ncbi:MAG: YeeE/YedE family protein [Bacteroidetes bacterium]|nr:MAG: YeeE/YedE family protein [Bacteroidota bacterium]PTM14967.1 MAG: YeeE/YedE family protein [Bacteroidota bacterium]